MDEIDDGYTIPYADPVTERIDLIRRSWDDLMRQRQRFRNRGMDDETGEVRHPFSLRLSEELLKEAEDLARRELEKELKRHPMYDWLKEAKTGGARVATILSVIRHPHRFPGQVCSGYVPSKGKPPTRHYMLPTFEAGEPCPSRIEVEGDGEPEPCPGVVEPPRRGTGCRPLWKMLAMAPETQKDGTVRLPALRRGSQASFNPRAKTAILMPQGIADQILMQKSRYAQVYYDEKPRLQAANPERRPAWIHKTALVIAAKAWSGDLLTEWKSIVPLT